MLRTSIRSARALGRRPAAAVAGRQWQVAGTAARGRHFADKKLDPSSKPTVLPSSETNTAERSDIPKPAEPQPTIASEDVPRTPPKPDTTSGVSPAVAEKPTTKTITPPPPPPPAAGRPKTGFFRRLRNFVFTLTILGALGFGGGVWYSRINDNFHDFFTEYVPYGEQAVLYLEEMDFRKRFHRLSDSMHRPRDTGAKVTIPAQSGASWRVADSGEQAGRHASAIDKAKASASKESKAKADDVSVPAAAAAAAPTAEKVAQPAKETPAAAPSASPAGAAPTETSSDKVAVVVPPAKKSTTKTEEAFKAPEVNEPSRRPPIPPIDPLAVNDAMEPVVQDLVRMLNDIIAVVNADKAHERYGSTIDKAKDELSKVGAKVKDVKAEVEKKAGEQVKKHVRAFDQAAEDLVTRLEAAMAAQEAGWRDQFSDTMRQVHELYEERFALLREREQLIGKQRLRNELLQQAVALKREFLGEVRERVERERDGRLGKLEDLEKAVADLEKLTAGWNEVVETSQRTQQLHVAVEAVRASLEKADHPRPFVRELVALKEIAAEDPLVDTAIATINPSAYQRGLPTTAQLVDRFRVVAGEVRKASLLPEDAGVASHASSYVLSKVLFKKHGLAVGNDVESVLTRTQTYLEEGDLDAAAREMNGLQGWAKTLSRDWLGEVRKVLEVQQALDVISTEARLQSLRVE
ncbi:hypothetical protein SODALDRAFT_292966 [Sodiomyces alkalinus F11]|uniref:MICOS complex subunit MIC60 n=1 Tax=Sodiomyces alkalinus (strain CBS 110278 / VKM F-3762 / F11) TaxID=1314773 RepID=A0A3N2PYI1_SODAK|nr:hypothetical protein SODALDRAFT_292966 [Sodiomyces alkalinus F11]ROT39557.1 hypothetical protein SODALDRAFT_292966 [Sodiomyces alkalinus F11]